MDQLGAGRGGRAGEIGLLGQQHAEAATGRIAGDADAVDAAADHQKIERAALGNGASLQPSTVPALEIRRCVATGSIIAGQPRTAA